LARRFILLVFLTALGFAMSLIITIFALVFITELISWIGKSVLLDLVSTFTSNHINTDVPSCQAYALHQTIFNASTVSRQKKLKTEILATKKELLQTSAQDQFAKWAKLKRSIDKGIADLEKISCVCFCMV
jgi:tail-anchored protein insertion receptor